MAQIDETPQTGAPGVDWVRLADGLFLLGLGVFAYLNATGRLPWTFWFDVLTLWPIMLVTAGLRIAFNHTRHAWLILLGPLSVLGLLAGMASGRLSGAPGTWQPVSEARTAGATRLLVSGALASSRLEIVARPLPEGLALEGRRGSRENRARLERGKDGTTDQVVLVNGDYGLASALPGRMSRWELGVTDAAPFGLRLEGAMVGTQMDLSHGQADDMELKGVFLGADLRLPRPKAPVRLSIQGVFNVVELLVPQGTPVRVHGPGLPANVLDRGTGTDPKDPANPGYDVKLEGIFSRVAVTTVP
ncbi:MAG: hypothetical protein ABW221_24125 [Vicinamibacteria bacterium]